MRPNTFSENRIAYDNFQICVVELRLDDKRSSLASFQIDTGAPLEVIQKTLGHGNKATTEIYARMAMDPVRASVDSAIWPTVLLARSTSA